MEQTANTTNEAAKNSTSWLKKNLVKILIVTLILAVAAELFFGGISLFSPSSSNNSNILAPRVNPLTDASLSLILDKQIYKSGDPVTINVKLFTGGYTTDSTDLVVKYDPAFLEPDPDKFAEAGNLYSEYPAIQIEKQKGLIGISGITNPNNKGFQGVGIFTSLLFRALKDGQTMVTIDFEPGQTADSNVVLSDSSKDILGTVKNADVLISGIDAQPPQAGNQSCESYIQSCQDSSGNTGTQLCRGGSTKSGSCSYDPEFTVSCEVCKI